MDTTNDFPKHISEIPVECYIDAKLLKSINKIPNSVIEKLLEQINQKQTGLENNV